jgi:hypothetical protein
MRTRRKSMDRIGRKTAALCSLVLLCLSACSKSQPAEMDAGTAPASSANAPVAAAPSAAAPGAQPLQVASERPVAPMKLVLKGPTPPPEKGDFELGVDVVASEPIVMPLSLHVEVPAGAKLAKGARDDLLAIKQAGTTSRQYTIHIDAPLTGPIVVTAETRDDAGVAGMRATKRYPGAAELAAPASASASSASPLRGPSAPR